MAEGGSTAKVDILHPLAYLHSVHCHLWWRDVNPTHCVLLRDKVAVLDVSGIHDFVHISSINDLSTWDSTPLPHHYTSLSTYQDQLVAVGGRQLFTQALTNELLTSSNGLNWQPTLPAMPTKRYWTSTVSRSPAFLVVAGGRGPDEQDLDIVEVLLDKQWSTVAPLPKAGSQLRSTLHDGSIYFIQGNMMYRCTCESLCTSQDDGTSASVWMKINAPQDTRVIAPHASRQIAIDKDHVAPPHISVIASCASRLIAIDKDHVISGYSKRGWTPTTITGQWEKTDYKHAGSPIQVIRRYSKKEGWTRKIKPGKWKGTDYEAAVGLPTGGLVVANSSGIYTLTLKDCAFDPDSFFITNVLSRLEVVMDIEILSMLDNTGLPGAGPLISLEHSIEEQEDHRRQYVVEIISRWSLRPGFPPTWRELLRVLKRSSRQQILAQHIETFMKGSRGEKGLRDSSNADNMADYPPLPKFVNEEKKALAGFSADNEVSVTYRGESGSLNWEECGLTLLFESSDHSSEVSECPVHVLAGESGAFRYPPRSEPASRVYHIECPKQLHAPVTIRIKHDVPDKDIPYMCFMMSSGDQPPYDFKILNEGNFRPTYAEITVKSFSFYILGILRKHGVKGILSVWEKSYAASLFCSVQPTCYSSVFFWKVYVIAVKNSACFRQSIKKDIERNYEENVKREYEQIVSFVDAKQSITAITNCESSQISMSPCGAPVIMKTDISRYVDATPPHIRYVLKVPLQLEETLRIKITLEGLQKPKNFLCLHLTIPQLSSSLPVSVSHMSPESTSSARTAHQFSMKNLQVLHIGEKKLLLIEEMASQWKEAGNLLGLRNSHIRVIQENNPHNVVHCCQEIMAEWLDDQKGIYNYQSNWKGLCKLLNDLKLAEIAEQIQDSFIITDEQNSM